MKLFNLRELWHESKVKFLWRVFFLGFGAIFLYFLLLIIGVFGRLPKVEEIENPQNKLATEIYSADSVLLGKYYFDNRTPVEYKDISPILIKVLVASEDERFYQHMGIDLKAIFRAIFYLGKQGGGSTITQQTAKNLFTKPTGSTIVRLVQKTKEYVISLILERKFTKEEIIALYLNTFDFVNNADGIHSASLTYFSKLPKDLNLEESAVLVAMLQNPSAYNPNRFPERCIKQRNGVYGKLLSQKIITVEQYNELINKPIPLKFSPFSHVNGIAPYFREVLSEQLKQWCSQNKKLDGTNYNIYKDGLKIYTTLDSRMQKYAEEAVKEHLIEYQKVLNAQYKTYGIDKVWGSKEGQKVLKQAIKGSDTYYYLTKEQGFSEKKALKAMAEPHETQIFTYKGVKDTIMSSIDSIKYHRLFLQTGFMVMEKETGHIKAWVGGIDFEYFKFDHANIKTKRQVGSTFKPILYSLAVDNGMSPCMNIPTSGVSLYMGNGVYWTPRGGKGGSMPMKSCLKISNNQAAAWLVKQLGTEALYQQALKMGIVTKIPKVPSIALGACEVSLYEMMQVYSTFLNNGVRTSPVLFTKIEDKNGNVIQTFFTEQKEVYNPNTAYIMTKMLEGPHENGGTATRLKSAYKVPGNIGCKTGTTNRQADGWFMGFTPQYLAGVWVGCDDPIFHFFTTYNGQGAHMAMPIWAKYFNKCFNDKKLDYDPDAKWTPPTDSTLMKNICRDVLKERMEQLSHQGGQVITTHGQSDIPLDDPDKQFE